MSTGNLRIALAQVNPTVGDIDGNADLIATQAALAHKAGAQLLVFPEMVLTGYPVEDLALRQSFRNASRIAISELAKRVADSGFGQLVMVVGYLDQIDGAVDRLGQPIGAPQNAVAVIHNGEIKARYIKHHLPNYGVFDEFRNFVPGEKSVVVRINGVDVGLAICEDIWHFAGPVEELARRKVGLVLVPNGSPYERNKDGVRAALVSKRALEIKAPLVYVNMVGGQDDLVFDGDSIATDREGNIIARLPQFDDAIEIARITATAESAQPDIVISEKADSAIASNLQVQEQAHSNGDSNVIAPSISDEAQLWAAMVVGLRDYVRKNRFPSVLIGLSGGIDSAITASIAARLTNCAARSSRDTATSATWRSDSASTCPPAG